MIRTMTITMIWKMTMIVWIDGLIFDNLSKCCKEEAGLDIHSKS